MTTENALFSQLIDKKSENIIYLLSLDSRRPISDIARDLGLSRRKVELRVQKLLDKGFIKHYVVFNMPPNFRVSLFLKLRSMYPGLLEKLQSIPAVSVVKETLGFYDIFCLLRIASREEMDAVVQEIGRLVHGNVLLMDVLPHDWTVTLGYKSFCHRPELLKQFKNIHPSDRDITKREEQTISLLRREPQIPYSRLAEGVGVDYSTVRRTIQGLQRDGFLRFSIYINYPKLGLQYDYMLAQIEPDAREEFERYCQSHPRVHWLKFSRGRWDYVLSIVSRNNDEFIDTTRQIRTENAKILLDSTSLIAKLAYDWTTG